jgi:hypothetical protein
VLDRAVAVAERQPRPRLGGAEARAIEQLARLREAADERAHSIDELLRRLLAGFGVRIVLVHHHESHRLVSFGNMTNHRRRGRHAWG